ncbi:MAG: STAS domain-containing protein [Exilibacterium sp.]
MAIVTNKSGTNEITITLGNRFDFNCAEDFRKAYEKVDEGDKKDFVLDFRHTHYIDSSTLGMLAIMDKYWQDRGSVIRIINSNPQLKRIFAITEFNNKFKID